MLLSRVHRFVTELEAQGQNTKTGQVLCDVIIEIELHYQPKA